MMMTFITQRGESQGKTPNNISNIEKIFVATVAPLVETMDILVRQPKKQHLRNTDVRVTPATYGIPSLERKADSSEASWREPL
jgi:hypothetical protein